MNREMVMDFVRLVMKVLGGVILGSEAAKAGGLDAASWQTITAAVLVMGGFGWSLWSTHHLTK